MAEWFDVHWQMLTNWVSANPDATATIGLIAAILAIIGAILAIIAWGGKVISFFKRETPSVQVHVTAADNEIVRRLVEVYEANMKKLQTELQEKDDALNSDREELQLAKTDVQDYRKQIEALQAENKFQDSETQSQLNMALKLQSEGKTTAAKEIFSSLVERKQQEYNQKTASDRFFLARLYTQLAYISQAQKKYEDMENIAKLATELEPKNAEAWYILGNAYRGQDKYSESLEAYESAVRLDPNDAKSLNNKGLLLGRLGRFTEAILSFDLALKVDPLNSTINFNRGVEFIHCNLWDEAADNFYKSIIISPTKPGAYFNLGAALTVLVQFENALKIYDRAEKIDPYDTLPIGGKINQLSLLGRNEEAIPLLDEYLTQKPNDEYFTALKAKILFDMGKVEEAREFAKKARALDPNVPLEPEVEALLPDDGATAN